MLSDSQKTILFGLLFFSFIFYSFRLYDNRHTQSGSNNVLADNGKKIWQQKNCIACHQIYQLGGYLGPDLTNTYSVKGPEYIEAFLRRGTVVMPDFKLNRTEITALIAYLKQIDASGSSDPRTFTIKNNGMIEQDE